MNATERLVQHIIGTQYDDLSTAAVSAAKTFFLDTLGVTVAGTAAPVAAEVRRAVSSWGTADEATILGLGERLPAGNAALINGFNAHCQEYDCVHEPAVVHPLASIQSAVLAWCERSHSSGTVVSGKELILALCLGVDVSTSIGMAAKTGLRFFRPATAGVFGATAAVARLAGLDRITLLDAMGLALAQCSGTMQAHVEGKPTLALLVGMAARAGIQAVDLAAAGVGGPHDVLEGPYGYYPLLEGDWDVEPVFGELGQVWRITQVSHKPFPCGRATHGGLDGIEQLKRIQHLHAEDIESLELLAPPLIHQLVGRPIKSDMQINYARLCFQYVAAVALLNDAPVDIPDFRPERLYDPVVHELAQQISVSIDDNANPNALGPQKIIVHLYGGNCREVEVTHTLGSPHNPLTPAAHLNKFRRCWGYAARPLPKAQGERVIEQVKRLDELDDISALLTLLQP
jgi:2-methylcitrate dehydratase PrpD